MTDKTTEESIHRALTEMGKLYSGEAPTDEDYDTVEALHEPLIEQLARDEVIYISDPNAIEPAIWLPYCRLLACTAAPSFGVKAIATLIGRSGAANVNDLEERERQTLKRMSAVRPNWQVMAGNYF